MSHLRKTRSPIFKFHSWQRQAAAPFQGLIPKVDGTACKISLSKYADLLGKLALEKEYGFLTATQLWVQKNDLAEPS